MLSQRVETEDRLGPGWGGLSDGVLSHKLEIVSRGGYEASVLVVPPRHPDPARL